MLSQKQPNHAETIASIKGRPQTNVIINIVPSSHCLNPIVLLGLVCMHGLVCITPWTCSADSVSLHAPPADQLLLWTEQGASPGYTIAKHQQLALIWLAKLPYLTKPILSRAYNIELFDTKYLGLVWYNICNGKRNAKVLAPFFKAWSFRHWSGGAGFFIYFNPQRHSEQALITGGFPPTPPVEACLQLYRAYEGSAFPVLVDLYRILLYPLARIVSCGIMCCNEGRVRTNVSSIIHIISIAFAVRQCAAWASTLITHKHSPKEL